MFGGIFKSVTGRVSLIALSVAGISAGMAVAGAPPPVALTAGTPVTAQSGGPVLTGSPGIALDFPSQLLAQPVAQGGAEQVLYQPVQSVETGAALPVAAVAPIAAAPPACVGEVAGALDLLIKGIPGIASPEQQQAMLSRAATIVDSARSCVVQAGVSGQGIVDAVSRMAQTAVEALGQIQGLFFGTAAPTGTGDGSLLGPVGTATGKVVSGTVGFTLGVVDTTLQVTGGLLGGLLGGRGSN